MARPTLDWRLPMKRLSLIALVALLPALDARPALAIG